MSTFDRPDFAEVLRNAIYYSNKDIVDAADVDLDSDWSKSIEEWDDGQPTHQQEVEALEEEDYCGID